MGQKTPQRMTVLELEQYLKREVPPGISTTMIYNHVRRAGLKLDAKSRVSVVEFMEAYMDSKANDNKNPRPAGMDGGQDPRRYKTVLECMILKMKHDEMKGELIPFAEHMAELREHAGWVRDVFAQWMGAVRVLTGDAAVVREAERLRDAALMRLQERIDAAQK